jgi:hypothetical protein
MTEQNLAKFQGAFYGATGLWPIVHMRSFLAVTGPKKDLWLVRTVGLLVTCVGAQLLQSSKSPESASEVRTLAGTCAVALAGVDTYYTSKRTISPVYLLDAAVEVGLALMWARSGRRNGEKTHLHRTLPDDAKS